MNCIFQLLGLFFLTGSYSGIGNNQADCNKNFKKGRFEIYSELTKTKFTITRYEKYQVELEVETGKMTEWNIAWLTPCRYKLTLARDNFGLSEQLKPGQEVSFIYDIIKTTKDYCIFTSTI